MKNHQKLYISPELYNYLNGNITNVSCDPYKSKLFSLVMILLSILTDDKELQPMYNRKLNKFDVKTFNSIILNATNEIFYGGNYKAIGDFLVSCVLNLNEVERLASEQAFKVLMDKFRDSIQERRQIDNTTKLKI